MVATRSAAVKAKTPAKARAPSTGARKTGSGTQVREDKVVADMLRDLQIDGKALSDRIERLRHRFL